WRRERNNHTPERLNGARAQVLRSFEERARDVFERGVNGQKDKRRVDMREHKHDGERAIKKKTNGSGRDRKKWQKAIKHAVAAKDGFPGVAADQIADPQRHDHELIKELLALPGVKSQIVSKRIAEKERTDRDRSRDAHGAEEHFGVNRIAEESFIIAQIPMVNDHAFAHCP